MITAGAANKKFKTELLTYDINGTTIKNGKTVQDLIGLKSDGYDTIRIKID